MATYVDLDVSFTLHPTTKDVLILVDTQAAKFALKDLLMTSLGEKPNMPYYGVGVLNLEFETISPVLISFVKRNITNQISTYLPEIVIQQLDIGENSDTGEINIIIQYYVKGNNQLQKYSLNITRIR